MIQRKQTLFLLAACILTGLLFIVDLGTLQNSQANWQFKATGIMGANATTAINTYPIVALIIISTLISFITIFSYKKRVLQLRLSGLNLAFLAGTSAIIYYTGQSAATQLGAVISFSWPIIAPLVALVLTILAMIAIRKDEALVKSLNRIR
jgi:hypothetical protein